MIKRRQEMGQYWEIPDRLQAIGREGRIRIAGSDCFSSILKNSHVNSVHSFFIGSNAEQLAQDRDLPQRIHDYCGTAQTAHVTENIRMVQRQLYGKRCVREWPSLIYVSSHWIVSPWFQKQNGLTSLQDDYSQRRRMRFHRRFRWKYRDSDFSLELPIAKMGLFDPYCTKAEEEKEIWTARRVRSAIFHGDSGEDRVRTGSDEFHVGVGHRGYSRHETGEELPGSKTSLIKPASDDGICFFALPSLHFVLIDPTCARTAPFTRISMGFHRGDTLKSIALEFGNFQSFAYSTCGADSAFANGFY